MRYLRLGLAALAVVCLLAAAPHGPARAMEAPALALPNVAPPVVLDAGQRFHHGKRAQAVYCYPRNRWWFYRPYTTAQENYPRCMPYFHYLDPPNGRRGARSGRYAK